MRLSPVELRDDHSSGDGEGHEVVVNYRVDDGKGPVGREEHDVGDLLPDGEAQLEVAPLNGLLDLALVVVVHFRVRRIVFGEIDRLVEDVFVEELRVGQVISPVRHPDL